MSVTSVRKSFIAILDNRECEVWLTQTLSEYGEVVVSSKHSIEQVLHLAKSLNPSAIFVQLQASDYQKGISLIEGLITAKPYLSIFVIADAINQELLLAAMRAGARDFIHIGTSASEIMSEVNRFASFDPSAIATAPDTQCITTAVISAISGSEAPMLASHLALALQEVGRTLLVDIGLPNNEASFYLGIKSSFSFIDAIHNQHRIDATLIDTGFDRHKGGLTVLSLPDNSDIIDNPSFSEIYVLFRTLQRNFKHIIINLGGLPRSGLLIDVLTNVDQCIMLIEQTIPSCRHNIKLINYLREEKLELGEAGLVVDRYLEKLPPDAKSLAKSFNLPLFGTLPSSEMARMATMNSGTNMFESYPNDPYVLAVRKLVRRITHTESEAEDEPTGFLHKLFAAFPPKRSKA